MSHALSGMSAIQRKAIGNHIRKNKYDILITKYIAKCPKVQPMHVL